MNALDVARQYLGVRAIHGPEHHPLIQWGFMLCDMGTETPDEVPWCSAFAQVPTHALGLERSRRANARSWLRVGTRVDTPEPGDVVVLWRVRPDSWQGHVGFFDGFDGDDVLLLGGNQGGAVRVAPLPVERVLGYVRLSAISR